jgi:hypothetical protein
MTPDVDGLIEKGATRLDDASAKLAEADGVKAKVSEELAGDAEFLRKLKPSAIAARTQGDAPPEDRPAPRPPRRTSAPGAGPNPLAMIAGAFVGGWVLAKVVDWRGHAHPRFR